MNNCQKVWKEHKYRFHTAIRYEDKNPKKMDSIFKKHVFDCSNGGKGAILGGVCRARLSEGIDFTDDQARLVIIVGVPLPNIMDPYVIMKREIKTTSS